jgi:hypothetical protein
MLMLFNSIYDLRKSYGALFRLSYLNYHISLRGEIQRLQYFDIRPFKLSGLLMSKVRFVLLRKTAHHSESGNL